MTKQNILEMKPLKDSDGSFKPIEKLYLDTTFFDPIYSYLPDRDESMKELISLCRSWIKKGDNYIIDLRTPGTCWTLYSLYCIWKYFKFYFFCASATIGVEYVLITLSEEFGQPIHICDKAYEKYCRIPLLASAVTKDSNTKFHACIVSYATHNLYEFIKNKICWKTPIKYPFCLF